jgi:hypothetical protein
LKSWQELGIIELVRNDEKGIFYSVEGNEKENNKSIY